MFKRVMTIVQPLAVACALLATSGPTSIAGLENTTPVSAVTLGVPGRTNASPSVTSDGAFVAVAWGAAEASGATDIYAAVSADSARTFGPPVRVNDAPGARTNGEQPPRVVLSRGSSSGRPILTIVWAAKGATGTKLVYARSEDGGKTFQQSAVVPDSDAAGNRGWHNAVARADGRVQVLWLDHRELARNESMPSSHHEHAGGKPDGVAMAQKSKLLLAPLDGAPRSITGGVCYCCKTAIATGADGSMYMAWRHVYPGNMRDIAFTVSRDGGRTFAPIVRVSEDRWMLEGCPDDGPALAVDAGGTIHIVWPTLVSGGEGDPAIAIFYASSRDGRTFTPRLKLPTEGMPHHPQIAVAHDGSIVAAWDESAGGKRTSVVAHARGGPDPGNVPRFVRAPLDASGGDLYPALTSAREATVVASVARRDGGSVIAISRLSTERTATP